MPYRDDGGEVVVARTAEGELRATLAGRDVELAVGDRSIAIGEGELTVVDHGMRKHHRVDGVLVLARGFPREDLTVWIEIDDYGWHAMERVFVVECMPVLTAEGLEALRELEHLAQRVRDALRDMAPDVVRASEVGGGHPLDKVLLVDHGERLDVYTRRLFGGYPRRVLEAHRDRRIALVGAVDEVVVPSRFAITVSGDFLRFFDGRGLDRVQLGIPWITPEERQELARQIAHFVDPSIED